ncbi:MAG TPA: DUF2062 domain-containing protein [Anaeromyxobacteraceae bacterium]|nr:DUF2062 domain-containing protein [Anaeromyxobacteraceae bacterium]
MRAKVTSFLRRRVADPVMQQLRQGVTPSRLALSLAMGLVLSSMPLLGFTGAICIAFAAPLRLNQPAILAANYAATPLQVALFVPFFRAGSWVFGAEPVPLTLAQIRAEFDAGFFSAMAKYWDANLRAMAVFALVAPIATALLYLVLFQVLSRMPLPRSEPAGTLR